MSFVFRRISCFGPRTENPVISSFLPSRFFNRIQIVIQALTRDILITLREVGIEFLTFQELAKIRQLIFRREFMDTIENRNSFFLKKLSNSNVGDDPKVLDPLFAFSAFVFLDINRIAVFI